jgi:hypothetical protein
MSLISILSGILNTSKKIDSKFLPSRGLFYPNDFEIKIKKASMEDIIRYESSYEGDVLNVIKCMKNIISKCCDFGKYSFSYMKSADLVFLFLEIVAYTNGEPVKFEHFDKETGIEEKLDFGSKNFHYFDPEKHGWVYNDETKSFIVDGYNLTIPSIGIEYSLDQFFNKKINDVNYFKKLERYNFHFLYFSNNKSTLEESEIENLLIIFNEEISYEEQMKMSNAINTFSKAFGYSFLKNNKVIDIKSKLDLRQIWKTS